MVILIFKERISIPIKIVNMNIQNGNFPSGVFLNVNP